MSAGCDPFDLELAQGEFEKISRSEHVGLTAARIADALKTIADEEDLSSRALSYLVALAEALDSPKTHWKLTLSKRRRGPRKSIASQFQQARRDGLIVGTVSWLTGVEQLKLEAAVASVCEQFGCSRATVFAALKRARAASASPE